MPKIVENPIVTPSNSRSTSQKMNDGRPLVTLSKGYTMHIGDHQFVKIQAEASCFTNPTDAELEDIAVTLQKLDGILESELQYHVESAVPK